MIPISFVFNILFKAMCLIRLCGIRNFESSEFDLEQLFIVVYFDKFWILRCVWGQNIFI